MSAEGRRGEGSIVEPGTVKIDGLREPEQAVAAVEAGADLIGFVFAEARRRVTPEMARRCIEAGHGAAGGRGVRAVGVFVDAECGEIEEVAEAAGLDLVQLHGEEPPTMVAALRRPVIKALRPTPGLDANDVARRIETYLGIPGSPIVFLIDGYSATAAGGEGVAADWRIAADLAGRYPLLLAGGLTAENVGGAIRQVRPLGVDVSSGVETDGVKDAAKMAAFVAAAKRGFAGG